MSLEGDLSAKRLKQYLSYHYAYTNVGKNIEDINRNLPKSN